jgi:hypothetical protein
LSGLKERIGENNDVIIQPNIKKWIETSPKTDV